MHGPESSGDRPLSPALNGLEDHVCAHLLTVTISAASVSASTVPLAHRICLKGACHEAALRIVSPILGLLGAAGSEACTWYVKPDMSGDAPTIQAAIDSASSGDSVLVASGVYDENLDTQGKRLFLIGQTGAEQTIIDGGFRACLKLCWDMEHLRTTWRSGLVVLRIDSTPPRNGAADTQAK